MSLIIANCTNACYFPMDCINWKSMPVYTMKTDLADILSITPSSEERATLYSILLQWWVNTQNVSQIILHNV